MDKSSSGQVGGVGKICVCIDVLGDGFEPLSMRVRMSSLDPAHTRLRGTAHDKSNNFWKFPSWPRGQKWPFFSIRYRWIFYYTSDTAAGMTISDSL